MSGHNKWSKIKHKKGASDARKSKIFSKHARIIATESRLSGGNKNAPALRSAIERARADMMPNENIERTIAKGTGAGADSIEEVLYELYGPGGVAILIRAGTDNRNRTTQEIKAIVSKLGYQIGTPGSAVWAFQKSGAEYVPENPTHLSPHEEDALNELIQNLDEHDDVEDVYTTAT